MAARKKSSKWDGGGERAVASSWPSFKKHKRKLAILFPLFFLHSTLCRAVRFLSTDEREKKSLQRDETIETNYPKLEGEEGNKLVRERKGMLGYTHVLIEVAASV